VKKALLILAGLLALAVCIVLGLALTQPDSFHIERSVEIEAPAELVYPYLEDLHRHQEWSPWDKLDPDMKRSYSGAERGTGAVYEWSGNDKAGAGKMTIVDAQPHQRVQVKLEFTKPFEASNMVEWTLQPAAGGCAITWSMEGPNSLPGKIMSVFIDMDTMLGKDFEAGLNKLKTEAERAAAPK
jgi:uncharacterized protein YndB with AHSA1/START domain